MIYSVCALSSLFSVFFSTAAGDSKLAKRSADYRLALQKHLELFEENADLKPVRCAKRLYSDGYVDEEVIQEVEDLEYKRGVSNACRRLLQIVKLSDKAVCHFVDNVLAELGLIELQVSTKSCPGPGKCCLASIESHQASPAAESTDATDDDGALAGDEPKEKPLLKVR